MEFLTNKDLKQKYGLSRTTIWRYERAGLMPKRKYLGPRKSGWEKAVIEAWIANPPAELARSRQ